MMPPLDLEVDDIIDYLLASRATAIFRIFNAWDEPRDITGVLFSFSGTEFSIELPSRWRITYPLAHFSVEVLSLV